MLGNSDSGSPWLSRRTFVQSAALAALGVATGSGTATGTEPGKATGPSSRRIDQNRLQETFMTRTESARAQVLNDTLPEYETGTTTDGFIGSFTKSLPHNEYGEVDTDAYETLLDALYGEAAFEDVPLAGDRKLINPSAARSATMRGPDAGVGPLPPAPEFDSAENAIETVELYWMALARDIPFSDYPNDGTIQAAADELSNLGADEYGLSTDASTLFRAKGRQNGPFISQFLYKDIPRGKAYQDQKRPVYEPGEDFMTDFHEWLSVQRGNQPSEDTSLDSARYITTGRDLATYVDGNLPGKMFRNAALILYDMEVPLADGLPSSAVQAQTIDYNQMQVPSAVPAVIQQVIRYTWFNKWLLHRRARPEVIGGRLHVDAAADNDKSYPLDPLLGDSEAIARVRDAFATDLLPQAYPQGSPCHPSYPAGHSTIAGACTAVLKAFFDTEAVIDDPVAPSDDGSELESIDATLTVGEELNKLATNNARGRDFAGIHYYSDGLEGIRGGEQFAIDWLEDRLEPQYDAASLSLTTIDGEDVTIDAT